MKTAIRLCLLLASAGPLAAAAQAPGWPERPVRVVVGAAPGSAPDIVARLIGDQLGPMWGKAVVVDNKPGAGGNLGAQAAARSAPDGYTLWFAHATPVVMNQFLFKTPGFDADKDFDAIVRVGVNPMMVAVNPAVPAKDIAELVALSKAKAGKLSFATSGAKNIPHLVGETLNQISGAGMVNVPYKGSQQAAQDTIGGNAEVYIDAVPPMAPLVGPGGRLRPIAVSTATRIPGFEQVPTLREQGIDLVMQGWVGFLAPAGTPREVLERVNRDVNSVLARPEVVARLKLLGTYELGSGIKQFDLFIRSERAVWQRAVQAAKIERE